MGGHLAHAAGAPAGDPASAVHRLDPRAKIVGLLGVTVVGVSTPLSAWPVWIGCAAVLASVAALARVPPGVVWRRARVVLPLVVFVAAFVPFVRGGDEAFSIGPLSVSAEGLAVLAAVSAKAAIGTVSAVLLTATTSVPAVIRGLEAMRVPRLLTLIAAFMYRYLFVVADELRRMRSALAARAYRPRSLLGAGALGRMTTALFLRSYARGERVYLAMAARGYTGTMPRIEPLRLARADAVFVGLIVAALLPLRAVLGVTS
jgi:cobalt/nickel transport system permease protein